MSQNARKRPIPRPRSAAGIAIAVPGAAHSEQHVRDIVRGHTAIPAPQRYVRRSDATKTVRRQAKKAHKTLKETAIAEEPATPPQSNIPYGFHLLPPEIVVRILSYFQPTVDVNLSVVDNSIDLPWSAGTTRVDIEINSSRGAFDVHQAPVNALPPRPDSATSVSTVENVRTFYAGQGVVLPMHDTERDNIDDELEQIMVDTSNLLLSSPMDQQSHQQQQRNSGIIAPTPQLLRNALLSTRIGSPGLNSRVARNTAIFQDTTPPPSPIDVGSRPVIAITNYGKCRREALENIDKSHGLRQADDSGVTSLNHTHIFNSCVQTVEMNISLVTDSEEDDIQYKRKSTLQKKVQPVIVDPTKVKHAKGLGLLMSQRPTTNLLDRSLLSMSMTNDIYGEEVSPLEDEHALRVLVKAGKVQEAVKDMSTKNANKVSPNTSDNAAKYLAVTMPSLFALRTLSRNWYKAVLLHPSWSILDWTRLARLPCCKQPVNFDKHFNMLMSHREIFRDITSVYLDFGQWVVPQNVAREQPVIPKISMHTLVALLMKIAQPDRVKSFVLCVDWHILGEASLLFLIMTRFKNLRKIHLEGYNDQLVTTGFGDHLKTVLSRTWKKESYISSKGKSVELYPENPNITHLGLGDARLESSHIRYILRMCVNLRHLTIFGCQDEGLGNLIDVVPKLTSLTTVWGAGADINLQNEIDQSYDGLQPSTVQLSIAVRRFLNLQDLDAVEANRINPSGDPTSLYSTLNCVLTPSLLDTSDIVPEAPEYDRTLYSSVKQSKLKRIIINVREWLTESLLVEILAFFTQLIPKIKDHHRQRTRQIRAITNAFNQKLKSRATRAHNNFSAELQLANIPTIAHVDSTDSKTTDEPLLITVFFENVFKNAVSSLLKFPVQEGCGFRLAFYLKMGDATRVIPAFDP